MKFGKVGAVIIGCNEGERLKRSIESVVQYISKVVYVDSGSSDGSVEWVNQQSVELVSLDMSTPFTAARARNAGLERLLEEYSEVEYVQFIDGDCYLHADWIETAAKFLDENSDVALVCGVRKEIRPDSTIYNYLCDLEWDGPKGRIQESDGDFLVRSEVMRLVDGFNPTLIAGEKPDLCFRIRSKNWAIFRLSDVMTYHDANITKLPQWWKRNVRSGHAYANVAHIHVDSDEKIYQKETLSILMWGMFIPLAIIISVAWLSPIFTFGVLLYVYLFVKCAKYAKETMNVLAAKAGWYSFHVVLGKFFHALGVLQYFYRRYVSRKYTLIEYK